MTYVVSGSRAGAPELPRINDISEANGDYGKDRFVPMPIDLGLIREAQGLVQADIEQLDREPGARAVSSDTRTKLQALELEASIFGKC